MSTNEIKVMASVSDYGVSPKDRRGVMDMNNGLPEVLKASQQALTKIAKRLNVDLNQTGQDLQRSFGVAFERRTQAKPSMASDSDLSLG